MSATTTHEDQRFPGNGASASALELSGAILLYPDGSRADITLSELRIDYLGVALRFRADDELRTLSWDRVLDCRIADSAGGHERDGAVLTLRTERATHTLCFPGAEASLLRPLLEEFSQPWMLQPVAIARAAPVPLTWRQFQPAMVVLLILVLISAVTLVLLQSAGAIHLPILGGNSSNPDGMILPLR